MPDLAKQFSRDEIIAAIEYIDEHQIDLKGSTVHLLEYNGNFYPPKEIVRWAAKLKKLKDWDNYRLSGGNNTNAPLKALGFSLTKKTEPNKKIQSVNKSILDQYKSLIKERGNQDELYKFYLIEDFRNKWDIDAADFTQMFLSIDFKNLIYHPIALTSLRNIASKDPEFLRKSIIDLFDEELGLNTRVTEFCSSLNNLYKSWNPKLQGGIDERTVATLMTLHDPSSYTFYKWTFYNEWCKKIGVKGAKTGECYFDYLEKIDDLIDNYIVEDKELLSLHQSYLSDVPFKDENYYILAQDIIYQVLEQLPKRKVIKDYKAQFQNWLAVKTKETSNKVSSYMQALVILSELTKEDIFKVSDLEYLQDLYKDLVQEQRKEDGKYYYAKSPSYGNNGYYSAATSEYMLFHRELLDNEDPTKSIHMTNSFPLNQILYGPPGTGKTYKLKNEYFSHFIVKEISQTREQFLNEFVSSLTWWQIITIVLLDIKRGKVLDIHNHELIQIKENLSASKTVRPTIWGQLQSHTVINCEHVNVTDRSEPLYFYKDSESYWTILEDDLKEKFPEAFTLYEKYKNHVASPDVEIHNYDFVTFHQSFSYEDFVEGIKPILDENSEGDIKFKVQDGVFKRLCYKARRDSTNNYALFIDEINRGNVSAIFGELITLIEDTKREGSDEELQVTLPYSKEKFSVPANLYIIGTMNTADRSVEALDTALRRRFVFEEMLPKPEILEQSLYGFKASLILKLINQRIEKLIDRDHCIGHAYFLHKDEDTIIDSFYKNIIPLLQEYFFGDYGKIGLVLGRGFVRLKKEEGNVFADFDYDYVDDLASKPIYEIIDYRTNQEVDLSFEKAIHDLMR